MTATRWRRRCEGDRKRDGGEAAVARTVQAHGNNSRVAACRATGSSRRFMGSNQYIADRKVRWEAVPELEEDGRGRRTNREEARPFDRLFAVGKTAYWPIAAGRGLDEIQTLRTIIPGTVAPSVPLRPTGAPMKA
jgi:hypothetical protein